MGTKTREVARWYRNPNRWKGCRKNACAGLPKTRRKLPSLFSPISGAGKSAVDEYDFERGGSLVDATIDETCESIDQ